MQNKSLQIFLLILIVIGVGLLLTQKMWVPKLVNEILTFQANKQLDKENKVPPITTDKNIKHFTDSSHTFTFDYNALFTIKEEDGEPSPRWRENTQTPGALLATVIVPSSFEPKTNLSDSRFTVGVSHDQDAMANCIVSGSSGGLNGESSGTPATVDGHTFKKFTSSDAGAGNYYDTTSYRGIVRGNCYAIEYTIHSTNISNYSPDQGITEFNKAKIQTELEKIVKSFKFLVNSD